MTHRNGAGLTRRQFAALGVAGMAAATLPAEARTTVFSADWSSLRAGYAAPDWFRDAKFGIWAHWSAQCVPEHGDWYARQMYVQGGDQYEYHVKTYGHPSRFGFMEFDNLWKAEHWDPEALMKRYVAAGAKYFVSLANHHDNFDNYASRFHDWNSVRIGPKKDIVGTWAKAARAAGLRFGVSNHSAHAWHWFQTAYGYDAEGPLKGVRYDAYRLTKADGIGKWWEGLDPQDLYGGRNMVIPDGVSSIAEMNAWHSKHDREWTEAPPAVNPDFVKRWKLRCLDLIDSYRPDLVYFDNFDLPLGQAGLDVAAHYYNANQSWHNGRLEAVINAKMLPPERRGALVEDVERGLRDEISSAPWQTDTCIGDWHYNRAVFEGHRYKSVKWVVQALCDIVAKNGNLLLSVPLRGDGTIDPDEEKFLDGMSAWMAINGEAIFETRPWRIFGEGAPHKASGMFNENAQSFSSSDIRFTQKNGTLYALGLGWPSGGRVRIRSLAQGAPHATGRIERIELLGTNAPLTFACDADALTVDLPDARAADAAYGLKILGRGLV